MHQKYISKKYDILSTSISINSLNWKIILFVFALLIPTEFSLNFVELRLTVYRLLLLLAFVPCLIKVMHDKNFKILAADWLFLGYAGWVLLSLILHLGIVGGMKSGGILMIESFGSYLLARSFIRSEGEYAGLVKLIFLIIIALSLLSIPEFLIGKNLFRPNIEHLDFRFGFVRAFGPFDHPILYGMYCASAVSLVLYVPIRNMQDMGTHIGRALWVTIAAFISISSGALAAAIVQFALALWRKLFGGFSAKWRLLLIVIFILYLIIDSVSNRTPIHVLLHRLTFSQHTAYYRLEIWKWGTRNNVAENPWFGIGFGEWVRPEWMHSSSIDNFWLVIMIRYGLPSFVLLALGIFLLFFVVKGRSLLSGPVRMMRTGWCFSLIGLIVAGCTVHFWNQMHVWFFFLLGSGAWIASKGDCASSNLPRK